MKHYPLTLKLECFGGTNISDACEIAVYYANKLDIVVQFKFNDVTCMAKPGSSAKDLEAKFHAILEKPSPRVICSHPPFE